ncbi:MAG: hypothetical protein EOO39_18885, partial [Cytophagaceae bacterium]
KLENGKSFRIKTVNNSPANRYIKRMILNGKPYTRSYMLHQTILNGGDLVIEMSNVPGTAWGVQPQDRPKSIYP